MPISTHTPWLATDSIWSADTAAADTIPAGEVLRAITVRPVSEGVRPAPRQGSDTSASWLMVGVLAAICLVCARYKNNVRYFHTLIRDLTNVRERLNLFDDTASESSFIFLLNLLCAIISGLMLYTGLTTLGGVRPEAALVTDRVWTCMLCTGVYSLAMPVIYWGVGHIFSDSLHTRLWVRGFLASQGLLALSLLLPAMAALFYPAAGTTLTIVAICILAILKLIFISKTLRIFFAQFSSWVLFLYYLCTLEILPLVLTYSTALRHMG